MVTREEIQKDFGHYLSKGRCISVYKLLTGKLDPRFFKSARDLERRCYNHPDRQYMIETAVNEAIEGFGIEGIKIPGYHVDNYHFDCVAGHVNTGDTDSATIAWDYEKSNEPFVTTWGDFLEAWEIEHDLRSCPQCGEYHDIEDTVCPNCQYDEAV